MKYIATKPLFLNEADWAPQKFAGKSKKMPKDYSFSEKMVKDKTPLNLPENEFIHGLAAEKLIIAVGKRTAEEPPEDVDEEIYNPPVTSRKKPERPKEET